MSQDLLNTYVIGFDRAIRETVEVKGGKLRPYVQLATGDLYRKEGVYQRTSGGGLPVHPQPLAGSTEKSASLWVVVQPNASIGG